MQNTDNIRIESRIQEEIEKLLDIAEGYSVSSDAAHNIEKGLFKQLLQLGKTLLLYIFRVRIRQLKAQGAPQKGGISLRYKGNESRKYLSLFGLLDIDRPSYWSKDLGKAMCSGSSVIDQPSFIKACRTLS